MIETRVAALGFPEHRFRGYAVFDELVGNETSSSLVALAVAGRRMTAEETATLDDIAAATLVGDPRIWPLKIIRLVASYGGVLAGYAGGHMAIEGDRIGPPVTKHAADLLIALRDRVGDHIDDRAAIAEHARALIATHKRLIGYGIPFRPYDERYVVLRGRLAARGRADLPFFRLQDVLSEVVRAERRIEPNAGVGIAAILLDMGFSPTETAAIFHFINQPVFIANAYEAATQASSEMRELPREAIAYAGTPPRESPRLSARRS